MREIEAEHLEWTIRTLEETGEVTDVATLIHQDGHRIQFAHTVRMLNGQGKGGRPVYVSTGKPVERARATSRELRERAEQARLQAVELMRGLTEKGALPAGLDPWLSKREAALYTGFSKRKIEQAVAAGELEQLGSPSKRLYRRSELDRWVAKMGQVLTLLLVLWLALVIACASNSNLATDALAKLGLCPFDR